MKTIKYFIFVFCVICFYAANAEQIIDTTSHCLNGKDCSKNKPLIQFKFEELKGKTMILEEELPLFYDKKNKNDIYKNIKINGREISIRLGGLNGDRFAVTIFINKKKENISTQEIRNLLLVSELKMMFDQYYVHDILFKKEVSDELIILCEANRNDSISPWDFDC